MFQAFRMFDGRQSPWPMLLASGAAVVLLTCSAFARADNCAGGADATGNDCTGGQAMSVRELSEADSHLLYLRGQAALAELRAARAKQRMLDAAAKVKAEEAELKITEAELKTARIALSAAEKPKQGYLAAAKAR